MARYDEYGDLQIGATTGALVSVIDLQLSGTTAYVPAPKVEFQEATEFQDLANADIKMLGKPVIRWSWPAGSSYTARKALRAFIGTAALTTSIYIVSPDMQGDLQTWAAQMRWPTEPFGYQSFEYPKPFTVEFFRCEQQ